jgi:flagellar biogenesis protein FliO
VEFKVLLTPMWVISQIQLYLIGVILFSLWRVRRRMSRRKRKRRAAALEALEESAASPMGYVPPQPTVEVLQVSDNGIVIKRRLVAT